MRSLAFVITGVGAESARPDGPPPFRVHGTPVLVRAVRLMAGRRCRPRAHSLQENIVMLNHWNRLYDFDRTFAELDGLRREMNRLFEAPSPTRYERQSQWPVFHLRDQGETLLAFVELPGVASDALELSIEKNVLSLKGERRVHAPEGYASHRQERPSVNFARSFSLPAQIDAERVEASLENGVLKLTLPKVAEDKPRKIDIATN
ncbi:MAG: Hsp20/alpha crystallin family protein [Myxococcota bacterium]